MGWKSDGIGPHLAAYPRLRPRGARTCQTSRSVASRESLQCNPLGAKNTCPVNSGRSRFPHLRDNFFPLGIPEDSLILGPITGAGCPPVIPHFPPYLVFDSGTRTSP